MTDATPPTFADLGLPPALLASLSAVGYETPTPIQAATIPPLLAGRDVLGQAQTGTGKTAAFALPILAQLDLAKKLPQCLVLAPTRELAIQVAEAFQKYAAGLPGFHVLPIYGGQSYTPQLRGLQRGAHVVVGTPGRVIDHLERGTLDLSGLSVLVLDEADEMLRMGFVDDVEAVLKKTPPQRQIALFSATMPRPIARIAETYLRDPERVAIAGKTTTAATVRQRYWEVSGMHKLDALTRILEVEPFEAMIVFSRTKLGTEELAEKLEARGFSAAAINGDMLQQQRERTINRLKDGQLDILVATDVAARGLDVERVSHIINFDIPHDTESYVHRIGRTGRAGREGDAILFVAPRERHLLRAIERATRQPITPMQLPTVAAVNDVRISRFKQRIQETLASGELSSFQNLIEQFEEEHNVPAREIAAALAKMVQGDKPLLMAPEREAPPPRPRWQPEGAALPAARPERAPRERTYASGSPAESAAERAPASPYVRPERAERPERERPVYEARSAAPPQARVSHEAEPSSESRPPRERKQEPGMQTYRLEVGHAHQVRPGNIVGAIANEAGLESQHIGRIEIFDDHSLIDLPEGMPSEVLQHLRKVWVSGQQLQIAPHDGSSAPRVERKWNPEREGAPAKFAPRADAPRFAPKSDKPFRGKPATPFAERGFAPKPAGKSFGDKPFSPRPKPAGGGGGYGPPRKPGGGPRG